MVVNNVPSFTVLVLMRMLFTMQFVLSECANSKTVVQISRYHDV